MFESKDPHIEYSLEGKVLHIKINRPEKKNALTPGMYKALGDGIRIADESDLINVILIRGIDDCFTSGNDVSGFSASNQTNEERPSVHFMNALNDARKPLVAAVSGLAIGIGTTLLFHCDLVYASESCFLQLPFTRLGLCPEAGSSYLLPKQIGYQRSAELMLLGDRFTSSKAKELGIVTEVLPQEDYLSFTIEKANELSNLPAQAVQTSKALLKRGQNQQVSETIEVELVEFGNLLQSDEAQAIVQAFLNKKK
ncbi:MAG: enoyl-CoA hydratase [Gammaproteobacteria bacterium]|jgi:enoyl-CoA hydratase/carnithine racemase|nr:enoyl-CoA hydratase [Gammaproteobacteria bacterium]MBT3858881.1 enoyl-CoA hydratase [Gammaproteobacteria bacterium]MBT3988209.1 enoyl-CoA hydratase [Gammaproteobacteria bacterium]MBT4255250.1 enoyl-CoA hydratase [Gammaproteobacteria bacterium]MBT4580852.1 enoyl-CoA hydratase [Gammaproteobacteria bacterium]